MKEFKKYTNDNIYNIAQINFWLEEYYNLNKLSKENWNKGSCFGELPCACTMS